MKNSYSSFDFPLIDLHRHLDGNIRVSTIFELAEKNGVDLKCKDHNELSKQVFIKDKTSDLLDFLAKLDIGVSVIANLYDCERIAFENVEDAVKQGLAHTELRFSPFYMAQANNLPLNAVVDAVLAGIERANKNYGYQAKAIGILSRTFGQQQCMQELDALLMHQTRLVAIDLAGDELNYPARMFTEHFNRVNKTDLKVTVHAGEADGPHSIKDAIDYLKADRIGHGVAAVRSDELLTELSQRQIGIEACLLSNYQTGTWLDMPSHPVHTFLAYDIPVFLNTDDPGVSNNTLTSEYQLAQDVLLLSEKQLHTLANNALKQAFLSDSERKRILTRALPSYQT